MKKSGPVIAISQRHMLMGNKGWVDYLENNYITYLSTFGVTIVPTPNALSDIRRFFDVVQPSGVILSGGEDIHPHRYGEEPDPEGTYSRVRDETEGKILDYAIAKNLPVLGICRGMQFLNVYFGGKLVGKSQSITNGHLHVPVGKHGISVSFPLCGTTTHRTILLKETDTVNSYHHQRVEEKGLAKGLLPFATVPDTPLIEGVVHERYPIAGLVWHPERESFSKKFDHYIISAFIKQSLFWSKRKR
jgi:gamma-glutamyl-gamma-aminobutyrate hydrolase PuuD